MPFLVLTGEKASGTFLIDQTRLVATDVKGDVVPSAALAHGRGAAGRRPGDHPVHRLTADDGGAT